MLFNSYEFIFLFLPLTFIGFFSLAKFCGKKSATFWLVIMSFFFYGWWDYRYVPLLFASICFNYFIGGILERRVAGLRGKVYLGFGILLNVLLLGYFKYTDFFLDTINQLDGAVLFDLPHIVLPLGISFFTFTQTAYLIDAYRGETRNASFLTYCEFVTIFPHLIAGPIINHRKMIPQFLADATFRIDYRNVAIGISLFTMGLFKKVVIADKLSPLVSLVFADPAQLSFFEAWMGALAYTFQLYFDFSGYSEMAIGLGLMFNLKFPTNFNSPYQAESIIDFWRRWHMTLGLWVKDYLYIPMGGNRHGELQKMRNLFASMLIIGLWHGAGWTFVFWGGLHGVFLMINHQWRRLHISFPRFINVALTFLCVVICWVFFRAGSFTDAVSILSRMSDFSNIVLPAGGICEHYFGFLQLAGIQFISWNIGDSILQETKLILALMLVLFVCPNPVEIIKHFTPNKKWLVIIIVLFIYAMLKLDNYTEFLYFQF